MKKKLMKKILKAPFSPFVLLMLYFLIIHFASVYKFHDDLSPLYSLENISIGDYIKDIYNTWSSRWIINLMVAIFCSMLPFIIWKILNIVVIIIIAICLSKLTGKDSIQKSWVISALLMIYPWIQMSTAGWIATSVTYLWGLAFVLISIISLKKILLNEKIYKYEYLVYSISTIIGSNIEQGAMLLFATYVVFAVFICVTRKKYYYYIFIQILLILLNIISIILSPGNSNRYKTEVISWFPDYFMVTLSQKIDMGISYTLSNIFFVTNVSAFIFCLLLAILVCKKYSSIIISFIGLLPLISITFLGMLKNITLLIFPGVTKLNQQLSTGINAASAHGIINFENFETIYPYITFLILVFSYSCILVSVYFIFGNSFKTILICYCLIITMLSTAALGFSPTIYASSTRVFIFLYFGFIYSSIILCQECIKLKYLNSKLINLILIFCALLSGINLIMIV